MLEQLELNPAARVSQVCARAREGVSQFRIGPLSLVLDEQRGRRAEQFDRRLSDINAQ